jgi:hypothetical protein
MRARLFPVKCPLRAARPRTSARVADLGWRIAYFYKRRRLNPAQAVLPASTVNTVPVMFLD